MLRIPSLREIFGLFVKSRTVAGATKVLTDTAHCLEEVVAHHNTQADAKAEKAAAARIKARALDAQVGAHEAEATQAGIVAANLTSLLK